MSKYQEQHYEDVATVLANNRDYHYDKEGKDTIDPTVRAFADLFATDNPRRCGYCNASEAASPLHCTSPDARHDYTEGFDRERFLKACGLEN